MGECSRCGECCKWLVIGKVDQRTQMALLHYLRCRCTKEEKGIYLLYSPCKHLVEENGKCSCDIYESRPTMCRAFMGRERSGMFRYYVPEGCTMRKK